MSNSEIFAQELNKLIERFRKEFDLTYSECVGVLHLMAFQICQEAGGI